MRKSKRHLKHVRRSMGAIRILLVTFFGFCFWLAVLALIALITGGCRTWPL